MTPSFLIPPKSTDISYMYVALKKKKIWIPQDKPKSCDSVILVLSTPDQNSLSFLKKNTSFSYFRIYLGKEINLNSSPFFSLFYFTWRTFFEPLGSLVDCYYFLSFFLAPCRSCFLQPWLSQRSKKKRSRPRGQQNNMRRCLPRCLPRYLLRTPSQVWTKR